MVGPKVREFLIDKYITGIMYYLINLSERTNKLLNWKKKSMV